MSRSLVTVCFGTAMCQQAGDNKDVHLPLTIQKCTKRGGCEEEGTSVVMDANYRWTHNVGGYTNCFSGSWNETYCPDAESCSKNCALEGIDEASWANNYGVTAIDGGLKLMYVPGSRMYLLDSDTTYKMFSLKNREFTLDIDMSTLPCGVNGALYFSEMEADGGVASSPESLNTAGAAYGTGYCDAQCPTDIHFIGGYANIDGSYGSCCMEMDIWEANGRATAYTPHPCNIDGPERVLCEGDACNGEKCDQPGCDFNPYRNGMRDFYGAGPEFTINTLKPFTVVTQFLTHDGSDDGDLAEIRRIYKQDGKTYDNSAAAFPKLSTYNSIKDATCAEQKAYFNSTANEFQDMGGLKQMGQAIGRGMVLALSVWDDGAGGMLWLDGTVPDGSTAPGAGRGPCSNDSGDPAETRAKYPDAYVSFFNIRHGEIDSTVRGNCCYGGDSASTCEEASSCPAHPWCDESEEHCSSNCAGIWCPSASGLVV